VVTDDEPLDLAHLHESARRIARLPDDERLRYVRADRWIGYTRATDALARLETLFAWPTKQRMPNLLLIGPTNNGKSMIVEKFRRAHPPIPHEEREEIPVLVVQMPSDPSVGRFYTALLAALGAPLRPGRSRLADLEQLVLRLLRTAGVRTLVIDELHNILGGRADQRREFLNLLRFLGNELRIPLVGVGIRDAYLAIRSDDQLENRFAPVHAPTLGARCRCLRAAGQLRRVVPAATVFADRHRRDGRLPDSLAARAPSVSSPACSPMPRSSRSSPARKPSTSARCCSRRTKGPPSGAGPSSANSRDTAAPVAAAPPSRPAGIAVVLGRPPGVALQHEGQRAARPQPRAGRP
jgi:hypothetical protein